METVQQNGRFTLFSSKFPSNIYSVLYGYISTHNIRNFKTPEANICKDVDHSNQILTLFYKNKSLNKMYNCLIKKI